MQSSPPVGFMMTVLPVFILRAAPTVISLPQGLFKDFFGDVFVKDHVSLIRSFQFKELHLQFGINKTR